MSNQTIQDNPIVSFPNAVEKTALDVREIISCSVTEHTKNRDYFVKGKFRNKDSYSIWFSGDSSELDAIAAWNLIVDTQRTIYSEKISHPYR